MFEKEAEEYIDKLTKDWSDGEYSISVEELRQAILHFAKFGYNKANEWHKGHKESPKISMPLILIQYRCHVDNKIHVALGKYDADYGGNKFQSDYWNVFDDEVIAWKEIVLPELKESE